MSYGARVDHQWRTPTAGLEDVLEENMSGISQEHLIPEHPIPKMQGAFEESMQETLEDADESSLARKDSMFRRKVLLERGQYQRTVAGKWKQRAGEKYHPLWKLIAMLSFGMHLLHQQCAKSDDEVIKLLQGHVDEVDGFLERTTEDFDLAQHDINERIRHLQLPLEHSDVFDNMLMDRNFRSAMVEGNEKIEHIVDRTALALIDSLKDVKKGSDGTKELARYLRKLEKTWHGRDDAITEVFQAMMGNTEGWTAAFKELQDKGRELDKTLEHLRAIIAEIQRLVGIASRRDVPLQYTSANASQKFPQSRPMSIPRSESPENGYNSASGPNPRTTSQDWSGEQDAEPDTLWSRARTPPSLHPNAILEEDDEYESPPRQPVARAPVFFEEHIPGISGAASSRGIQNKGVGAAAAVTTGLSVIAAASAHQVSDDESVYLTPNPFARSGYSPQSEIIEEEEEEQDEEEEEEEEDSDDSDYTIDIIDATPITAAPVKFAALDLNTQHDQSRTPANETSREIKNQLPDYNPPNIAFESSIPRPTRDSIEEAKKEFILPPLDLESETPLPALTPLDYERMRADFTLPPFDLRVPEEYTSNGQDQIDEPSTSSHPFHRKENMADIIEEEFAPQILPTSTKSSAEDEKLDTESTTGIDSFLLPRKPIQRTDEIVPASEQFHQKTDTSAPTDTSDPDISYQSFKQENLMAETSSSDEAAKVGESDTDTYPRTIPDDLPAQGRTHLKPINKSLAETTSSIPDSQHGAQSTPEEPAASQLNHRSLNPLAPGSEITGQLEGHKNISEPTIQHQAANQNTAETFPIVNTIAIASAAGIGLPPVSSSHADVLTLSKQPRQLPIDNLLVRLRLGNGLITPTEPISTSSAKGLEPLISPESIGPTRMVATAADNVEAERKTYIPTQSRLLSDERENFANPSRSESNEDSVEQHQASDPRDRSSGQLSRPEVQSIHPASEQVIETQSRHPTITVPFLRRRASCSDNRMTQRRPPILQSKDYTRNGLLSPEAITTDPRYYPQSARVPSSNPWTFFSKDDMDHSYRHRRAHSMFSPATPYDLEWLLRRTPSDSVVSPMRWSEIYGFKTGHNSIVSPMRDPLKSHTTPFAPCKRDQHIDSVLNADERAPEQSKTAEILRHPNPPQIDLTTARDHLSQAVKVDPILPSWKEPAIQSQKVDRSILRASSVYSRAADLTAVASPPGVPQIVRSEARYNPNFDDDSMPSSAYTDATFGQISPPPAMSSAKPSPLRFIPKDRIVTDPGSPSSPKEDDKFPAEISDEKHTVVEAPNVSPSLQSLVSATITGPEPDFPFLAATYGGPEPEYYYPTEEVTPPLRSRADRDSSERRLMEPSNLTSNQFSYTQDSVQPPPVLNNYPTIQGRASSLKKREGPPPALNFKLFPSTDSVSRGPSSPYVPRVQDTITESGRPTIPPSLPHLNLTHSNPSNPNLLALPPLTQEPMTILNSNPNPPLKSTRFPLKKLFKGALSPVLLVGKLKRDKDKDKDKTHRRGKSSNSSNSTDKTLAKGATIAHAAQFVAQQQPVIHSRSGNGSIDTSIATSTMRNGNGNGIGNPPILSDGRRPSGERIFYGGPGADGRPF